MFFKHTYYAINRIIPTKKITAINSERTFLSLTCGKIIVLLGIAHDHILCFTTLWFYPHVKHKRKFSAYLIPVLSRKSTIYCITYAVRNFNSKFHQNIVKNWLGSIRWMKNFTNISYSVSPCFNYWNLFTTRYGET